MPLDLVEIALSSITDSSAFEKLATEIVRDEGYPNVRPLGGVKDEGVDAQQDRFFEADTKRTRTVFQYTLQEYLTGKLNETVAKLDKNSVQYNELVIVTTRKVSSERQVALVKHARRSHQVSLTILERATLVNRLANFSNGIFHRFFPDIRRQVDELYAARPKLMFERDGAIEKTLLRAALAFSVNPAAERARRSVAAQLVLGILLEKHPEGLQRAEIVKWYADSVGAARLSEEVVAKVLESLRDEGMVTRKGDHHFATPAAVQVATTLRVVAGEEERSLVLDIVERVTGMCERPLSREEKGLIERNTTNAIAEIFRCAGVTLSGRLLLPEQHAVKMREPTDMNLVAETARRQLTRDVGDLLTATLADVLYQPTPGQAAALKTWALAYVGSAVMSLDPALAELQRARFSDKTFVIDTDFLLDCIVEERPIAGVSVALVKRLIEMGARVLLPRVCLCEGALHASIAPRTYRYFGGALFGLSESMAHERIWNVFVAGYYHGRRSSRIRPDVLFEAYLRNYYDPESELEFFTEVIKARLPEKVEIVEHENIVDALADYREPLAKALMKATSESKKNLYRSEEDIRHLADVDAALFLSTLSLNQEGARSGQVLGGRGYLITSSAKYIRGGREVGIVDEATTRPEALLALLDLMGEASVDPGTFVRLLQNPLLISAVEQSWEDVRTLVQSGVDLRDSSLARLRWDLDRGLHARVAAINDPANATPGERANAVADLVREARDRGYEVTSSTRALVEQMEKQATELRATKREVSDLEGRLETVMKTAQDLGKKKQRQLQRLATKKKPGDE